MTVFNIPETITHYLTYVLILHIVALGFAALSTIFGLLSHIGSLSVMCFPTCFASLASSFSLLSLIFDLVMFYIARARIDAVAGASASIGMCVWLTLAAWLLAGFGGCAYGVGRCCMGQRAARDSGDPSGKGYSQTASGSGTEDMRLLALRDEQLRKKEQGLPNFQELERTPLTAGEGEDKYLYEEPQAQAQPTAGMSGLRRDGSVVQGVGMGYGRRTPGGAQNGGQQGYGGGWNPQGQYGGYRGGLQPVPVARRPSAAGTMMTNSGNAGVGAGGQGVESEEPQDYGGYYGNQQHNCESSLNVSRRLLSQLQTMTTTTTTRTSSSHRITSAPRSTNIIPIPTLPPARQHQHPSPCRPHYQAPAL